MLVEWMCEIGSRRPVAVVTFASFGIVLHTLGGTGRRANLSCDWTCVAAGRRRLGSVLVAIRPSGHSQRCGTGGWCWISPPTRRQRGDRDDGAHGSSNARPEVALPPRPHSGFVEKGQ